MIRNAFSSLGVILTLASCSYNTDQSFGETQITKWRDDKTAAISITYDDATINQFRKALPIMDSLGFKATFYINTTDIPGSQFAPKYFGRPLIDIIKESAKTPTTQQNLFERASALRFLDIENAVESHNSAGSLFEQGKSDEAFKVVDEAFAKARKRNSGREVRPVLLTGELITWDEIRNFAKHGHEFGNHTISHPRLAVLDEANMLYEIEKGKEEIFNQLGAEHTFSAECPFGTENERVMEYALEIHPALRNRMPEPFLLELNRSSTDLPGIDHGKEYVQWQRGPLKKHGVPEMKSWVDTLLIHNNVWLVLTFHGVDGIGWEAKPSNELREYFSYMKQHEAKLWIAPFKDVTKYMRERMSASLKSDKEGGKIRVTLTHSLDKNLYNIPLTLKTYVNSDWKEVKVTQGDQTLTYKPQTDERGAYILYPATPGDTAIEIASVE
jgi:peptidoglycan/xylan/chitin deacetylase (PgdA/CDA1 family)